MEAGISKEVSDLFRALALPVEDRRVAKWRRNGSDLLGVTACGAAWNSDHLRVQFVLLKYIGEGEGRSGASWTCYTSECYHLFTAEVAVLPIDGGEAPILFVGEGATEQLSAAAEAASNQMEKLGASTIFAAVRCLEEELAQRSPGAFRSRRRHRRGEKTTTDATQETAATLALLRIALESGRTELLARPLPQQSKDGTGFDFSLPPNLSYLGLGSGRGSYDVDALSQLREIARKEALSLSAVDWPIPTGAGQSGVLSPFLQWCTRHGFLGRWRLRPAATATATGLAGLSDDDLLLRDEAGMAPAAIWDFERVARVKGDGDDGDDEDDDVEGVADATPKWRALCKAHGTRLAYHGTDAAALWSILNSGLRCFSSSGGGEEGDGGAGDGDGLAARGQRRERKEEERRRRGGAATGGSSSALRQRRGFSSKTAKRYTSHGQMLGDGIYLGAVVVAAKFAKARVFAAEGALAGLREGASYAPVLECEIIDSPINQPPPTTAGTKETADALRSRSKGRAVRVVVGTYFVVKDPAHIRIRRILFYEHRRANRWKESAAHWTCTSICLLLLMLALASGVKVI